MATGLPSPSSRASLGLHALRRVRYKQLFRLIPKNSELVALEQASSVEAMALNKRRVGYEEKKAMLQTLGSPDSPPVPPRRNSLSSYVMIQEGDPVFFNSAANITVAQSVLSVYNHEAASCGLPLTTRQDSGTTPDFPLHLALTLLYILSTSEVDDMSISGTPIPAASVDPSFLEHDTYEVFREIYPLLSLMSYETLAEDVSNILRNTSPEILLSPDFDITDFHPRELFLPLAGSKYLLMLWDGLFEMWCESDFFQTSRKDEAFDTPAVYYNTSDPLAAQPQPQLAKDRQEAFVNSAAGSRSFNGVGVPPLFAEIVAALALSWKETGLATTPNIADLFDSPQELFFAASILKDPFEATVGLRSCDPSKIMFLSNLLKLDPAMLTSGCDTVSFAAGPLGMMLRHDPAVGLIMNSFQENSQAANSGDVMVGDVLVAVNGWRLDKVADAHGLIGLISQLSRPVLITFVHADVKSTPVKVMKCLMDGFELPLIEGESLLECRQCQMKASTFGLAEAAGGMAGVGVMALANSPLQHPMTSSRAETPVGSSWLPGVAMVSGALFLTNYRIVFHRARGDGFCVDKSVRKNNERRRRESRSPTRSTSPGPGVSRTSSTTSAGTVSSSRTSGTDEGDLERIGEAEDDCGAGDDDFVMSVLSVLKVDSFTDHEYGIVKVNVPTLGVITKDGRAVKFVLPFQLGNTHEGCRDLVARIVAICFDKDRVGSTSEMSWGGEWKAPSADDVDAESHGNFHLTHKRALLEAGWIGKGKKVFGDYSLVKEYERVGLLAPDVGLRCVNSSVDLSPVSPDTYPNEIVVPGGMTNEELKRVCSFRSRGRIPALTYFYKETRATISRSSQPLVGLGKNRCLEDEKLLARIMTIGNTAATPKGRMYICDARKKTAATGNKIMGKGTEDVKNYVGTVMLHMDIKNIHAVRESEGLLWDLCRPSSSVGAAATWHGKLESTGWLSHVHRVLAAAARCAAIISQEGCSVLVHCSDGWDRTAQLTSLTQILLDPYYRTFIGFRALIEKEWLCFGHKFEDRNGRGVMKGSAGDEERSPIFLLFLDCLWQVMQQFPTEFEYNEEFLVALMDQVHAGRSGTFLYNSKSERKKKNLYELSVSVWDVLVEVAGGEDLKVFSNGQWNGEGRAEPLVVNLNCKNIKLWEQYWSRFDTSLVSFEKWSYYL